MKACLVVMTLCLVLATGTCWASIAGTTSAGDFQDTVDWCQFGCNGVSFPTPQAWTSADGATGLVGLSDTGQSFLNLQEGVSWSGDFQNGMGLIYNAAAFGNTPTGIAITFDEPTYGAGAYIQADYYGSFTATVVLYDIDYQEIGSYTTNGVSAPNPGTALFIGITDSDLEVYAAQFLAYGIGPSEPDFAIGTLGIRTIAGGPGGIPEPASFLLIGPALLGVGMLKRRLSH